MIQCHVLALSRFVGDLLLAVFFGSWLLTTTSMRSSQQESLVAKRVKPGAMVHTLLRGRQLTPTRSRSPVLAVLYRLFEDASANLTRMQ